MKYTLVTLIALVILSDLSIKTIEYKYALKPRLSSRIEPIDLNRPVKLILPTVDQTTHRWLATSASFQYCHDPIHALAIMEVENNFNNTRALTESSTGIMQVKPETAKWIKCRAQNEQDLLNIELNVECGCRYLGRLGHTYKTRSSISAAYNAGAVKQCYTGVVQPSGKTCPIGGYINQDYVDKVMNQLKAKYGYSESTFKRKWSRKLYAFK